MESWFGSQQRWFAWIALIGSLSREYGPIFDQVFLPFMDFHSTSTAPSKDNAAVATET